MQLREAAIFASKAKINGFGLIFQTELPRKGLHSEEIVIFYTEILTRKVVWWCQLFESKFIQMRWKSNQDMTPKYTAFSLCGNSATHLKLQYFPILSPLCHITNIFTEELVPVQIKMATSSPIQKNCHLIWCHSFVKRQFISNISFG